jgi:hypothetical protein
MCDRKPSESNLTSHISHQHWDLPFDLAQGGELVEPLRTQDLSNLEVKVL